MSALTDALVHIGAVWDEAMLHGPERGEELVKRLGYPRCRPGQPDDEHEESDFVDLLTTIADVALEAARVLCPDDVAIYLAERVEEWG
jgi:hypothetical protein